MYTPKSRNKAFQRIDAEFMQRNPGVAINRTAKTLADTQLTLRLAISGHNGPVVAGVNQGAIVKEHGVVPLDGYAERCGWAKRSSATVLDRNRWADLILRGLLRGGVPRVPATLHRRADQRLGEVTPASTRMATLGECACPPHPA